MHPYFVEILHESAQKNNCQHSNKNCKGHNLKLTKDVRKNVHDKTPHSVHCEFIFSSFDKFSCSLTKSYQPLNIGQILVLKQKFRTVSQTLLQFGCQSSGSARSTIGLPKLNLKGSNSQFGWPSVKADPNNWNLAIKHF